MQVGHVFGRYRIDEQIGQGGMGTVYAATDTLLGRQIALKVLPGNLAADPVFRARFEREAQALARLASPHVTTIFDVGEYDGSLYLATQMVHGGDLVDLLETGLLSPAAALRVAAQLCDALADAHAVGVIHRDVKPGNVLVQRVSGAEPHVYLCDFGICQTEATSGLTTVGYVVGSWKYLAPERVQGGPASPASDLYAVGCVLWTCVTGATPYGGTDAEVADGHANAAVPTLPGHDEFNRVLGRLLAKDPARRYAAASLARDDLLFAADRSESAEPPAESAEPPAPDPSCPPESAPQIVAPAPPRPRRPLAWAVASAAALALGIGAATLAVTWSDGDPAESDGRAAEAAATDKPAGGDVLFVDEGELVLTSGPANSGRSVAGAEVRIGDLSGDGADRPVLIRSARDALEVSSDETSTQVPLPTSVQAIDVQVGDLTGDGRDDLVVVADDDGIYVAPAGNDGEFEALTKWWDRASVAGAQSFAVGDFDGDGTDDLAWANSATVAPELTLLGSTGRGLDELARLDRRALVGSGRVAIADLAAVDLDGDGRDELAVTGAGIAPLSVWEYADQAWVGPESLSVITRSEWQTAGGDLDGDGRDELVLHRQTGDGHQLAVVRDAGSGLEAGDWEPVSCSGECDLVGVQTR